MENNRLDDLLKKRYSLDTNLLLEQLMLQNCQNVIFFNVILRRLIELENTVRNGIVMDPDKVAIEMTEILNSVAVEATKMKDSLIIKLYSETKD